MKKYFQISLIILLSITSLISQNPCNFGSWPCDPQLTAANNEEYHLLLKLSPQNSNVTLSQQEIDDIFMKLNDFFSGTDIEFHNECSLEINSGASPIALVVDIPETGFSGSGAGVIDDYFSVPENLLATRHLAHELGHLLGLLHTHHPLGNPANNSIIDTDIEYPSDTSDCENTGDCICDTEPDHGSELVSDYWGDLDDSVFGLSTFSVTETAGVCTDSNDVTEEVPEGTIIATYDPDYTNIMSYYPDGCAGGFTVDQGTRMRNAIKYCTILQKALVEVNPTGSFNWTSQAYKNVKGTVLLSNGESGSIQNITINFISKDSKIVVKEGATLNISLGARLTSPCSWEGIVLDGGTLNVLADDNVIENARIGVNVNPGSTLNVIESLNSMITFKNNLVNGIRAIDATMLNINDATFDDCKQAILISFPSGNIADGDNVIVNECVFTSNDEDLKVIGANGDSEVEITGNEFSGKIGINLSGENFYTISGNTFSDDCIWSTLMFATGHSSLNFFRFNDVESDGYGVVAFNENLTVQLEGNCFNGNTNSDVIVSGRFGHQGTVNVANANCFSQDQVPDILAYTSNNPFNYHEPLQVLSFNQCVYSTTTTPQGVTRIQTSTSGIQSDCNVTGTPTGYPNSPCIAPNNSTSIDSMILQIKASLLSLSPSQFNSQNDYESEKALLERCLIALHDQLAAFYISIDSIPEAIDVYENYPDFNMQIKGYFIHMSEDDYSDASEYLDSLTTSSQEEIEFIQSSKIYISALEQGPSFSLDSLQSDTIYDAAVKENELSGYSRAIWLFFTVQDIKMNITLPGGGTIPRSFEAINYDHPEISFFPVPTSNLLFIENELPLNEFEYYIELINANGMVMEAGKLTKNKERVDMSTFPSGIYFIRIYSHEAKFNHVEKLIKL